MLIIRFSQKASSTTNVRSIRYFVLEIVFILMKYNNGIRLTLLLFLVFIFMMLVFCFGFMFFSSYHVRRSLFYSGFGNFMSWH